MYIVKLLVSRHNADINVHNDQNVLPLHLAAERGHTNLVKAFIKDFNCNPNEKDLKVELFYMK